MRAKLFIALSAVVAIGWVVPNTGTTHFVAAATQRESARGAKPLPARLRINKDRGLLLTVWVGGSGPYVFAVDTGAGMNLISQRVVDDSRLTVRTVRTVMLGGLSAATTSSNREAVMSELAFGDRGNIISSTKTAVVVPSLASGVDGILDPTDAYSPFAYSIDMTNQRIEAVDTDAEPSRAAGEGATVPWLRFGDSLRPFVRLGDGRMALVDTGSGFGLAVNQRDAVIVGPRRRNPGMGATRDIGGGTITLRRVDPTTISIGELVLRSVPTDILFGIEDDAPVILGRDVLYPFKITFNPKRRLIEFTTSERKRN